MFYKVEKLLLLDGKKENDKKICISRFEKIVNDKYFVSDVLNDLPKTTPVQRLKVK